LSHHRLNCENAAVPALDEGGKQSNAKKRSISGVSSIPSTSREHGKSNVIVLKDDIEPRILDFDPSSIKIESDGNVEDKVNDDVEEGQESDGSVEKSMPGRFLTKITPP
jgi:hypothetical protein